MLSLALGSNLPKQPQTANISIDIIPHGSGQTLFLPGKLAKATCNVSRRVCSRKGARAKSRQLTRRRRVFMRRRDARDTCLHTRVSSFSSRHSLGLSLLQK